jgi:hypothetical protein
MKRVELITQWTVVGGVNTPAVSALITSAGGAWQDITGTPGQSITPEPNAVVIEATVADETLAVLQADANVFILSVEEIDDAPE